MAYNQGQYQQQQQQQQGRPYDGRAAQRPAPQGYAQPQPQQQYPPQQYDQYPQDGYGYDDYNNGYAQDGYGNGGYQDMNGGGRGGGGYQDGRGGYPPQDQGYPPQQEYYDNRGRGGMSPNGGGMPQGRGGPMQRPPTADGQRGGFGGGRGYANGGPGGRGGRPAPLDRSASSDPGQKQMRKPLKTPPISPDVQAWDNPFPSFPGAKKKTSISEEQKIINQMASMDMNGGGAPNGRPRTAGSKSGRRPTIDADDYGRPSGESQRSQPRGPPQGPPQQGYSDQRRGPPGPGYGPPPRQDSFQQGGYNDGGAYGGAPPMSPVRDDFNAPSRSMTMPNNQGMNQGMPPPRRQPTADGFGQGMPPTRRQATMSMEDPGPSAPYNGPIGRGMPPRPSTASGHRQPPNRPPPQRIYQSQPPPEQQQYPPSDPYANGNGNMTVPENQTPRLSEVYDSYYEPSQEAPRPHGRTQSDVSEMPNFDAAPPGPGPGNPIEKPGPNGFGQQVRSMRSQPDIRARAQPQTAVFEMAGDVPPMPEQYQQGYQGDQQGYQPDPYAQNGQYDGQQQYQGQPQGYGGQNGYDLPPRGASRNNGPNGGGFVGLPNGPSPAGAGFVGLPSGPKIGAFPGPRSNSLQRQSPGNGDSLPSHPTPVRPGLISNPNTNMVNKPPPVRNYNGVSPQPSVNQPQPQQAQQAAAPAANATPPPVTAEEIERLRAMVKANPNGDQNTQFALARKLVEASEVLVLAIPDQRARNKAREKFVFDAHKLLKKLVQAQNTEAMFYLADCHGRGALGLEADNKEAFTLYQSAAKAGHAAAAYRTAVCCELGNEEGGGTRKDPLKAIQWYKRAATLGDTPAMYKMGMIGLKGLLGQPKNPREAVGWLKRAAERADAENPHALHELGLLYEAPQSPETSVVRDEAYSFQLFQQAADLGYKFSQFRMGCAFEYGLFNCPIDPRQSIMWYSRAAVQEEHQSELALSGWYLTGSEGVLQQSDTEAYLWARKAAMAGLAKAEYAMGYFTEVGIGAPGNLEDAKRWYWRAAAQNFPKARERLEDLKKGGSKSALKSRERISRSKIGKQNEGECAVM